MWSNGHLLSKRGCQNALHNSEFLFPLFWKKSLGTRWLRDLVIEYETSHLSIDHSDMTYCVSHRKSSDYLLVSYAKWDSRPLLQPSSSWTDFPVEMVGFCSSNLAFSFKKKSVFLDCELQLAPCWDRIEQDCHIIPNADACQWRGEGTTQKHVFRCTYFTSERTLYKMLGQCSSKRRACWNGSVTLSWQLLRENTTKSCRSGETVEQRCALGD